MTIEVEDGTGKSNADSYIALADANAYFEARGVETWAEQDDVALEAALRRATAALDSWLRGSWVGTKKTRTQALAWPRTGVVDEDGFEWPDTEVPTLVAHACAEIALVELTERFIQQSVSRDNTIASESVGPISVSYRADSPTNKRYPHIEAMLRGFANSSAPQVTIGVGLTAAELAALEDDGEYDLGDYVIKTY